jgi:hypothetical protein
VLAASAPAPIPPLRTIRVLALPGVYNSELMAPYDVLQHLKFHVKDAPEIFTVAPRRQPLRTFEGLTLTPHHDFASARRSTCWSCRRGHNVDDPRARRSSAGGTHRPARAPAAVAVRLEPSCWRKRACSALEQRPFRAIRTASKAFPSAPKRGVCSSRRQGCLSVGGARSYEAACLAERLYGRGWAKIARPGDRLEAGHCATARPGALLVLRPLGFGGAIRIAQRGVQRILWHGGDPCRR